MRASLGLVDSGGGPAFPGATRLRPDYATRKLNRPSLASHPVGARLNRPDDRGVIPLKYAAPPGFRILLFLAS